MPKPTVVTHRIPCSDLVELLEYSEPGRRPKKWYRNIFLGIAGLCGSSKTGIMGSGVWIINLWRSFFCEIARRGFVRKDLYVFNLEIFWIWDEFFDHWTQLFIAQFWFYQRIFWAIHNNVLLVFVSHISETMALPLAWSHRDRYLTSESKLSMWLYLNYIIDFLHFKIVTAERIAPSRPMKRNRVFLLSESHR